MNRNIYNASTLWLTTFRFIVRKLEAGSYIFAYTKTKNSAALVPNFSPIHTALVITSFVPCCVLRYRRLFFNTDSVLTCGSDLLSPYSILMIFISFSFYAVTITFTFITKQAGSAVGKLGVLLKASRRAIWDPSASNFSNDCEILGWSSLLCLSSLYFCTICNYSNYP